MPSLADEIINGRFSQISLPDGAEEKRIRDATEEIVRREDARKSLPQRRVQRAHRKRSEQH